MFIHPSAEVALSAKIGSGTKVWHDAQVRDRAIIGSNGVLGKGVYIDEDVVVGDNVKIQNRASIYKHCTIEDGVFVGPHVCFTNDVRPRAINPDGSPKSPHDWKLGSTHVRRGASIGAGSIILPNRMIGSFALIGAGSVVTRDVPDHALVFGNPALLVGYVCKCGHRILFDDLRDASAGSCSGCEEEYARIGSLVSPVRNGVSS
jgi:acetyltransferase-like isoleucine patch superfamily enzyme